MQQPLRLADRSAPSPAAPESPAPGGETGAAQLAEASRALWLASLSLMTAFMATRAPAHRLLMARRLARNFGTLAEQPCFDRKACASFARLARRWQANADRLAHA